MTPDPKRTEERLKAWKTVFLDLSATRSERPGEAPTYSLEAVETGAVNRATSVDELKLIKGAFTLLRGTAPYKPRSHAARDLITTAVVLECGFQIFGTSLPLIRGQRFH